MVQKAEITQRLATIETVFDEQRRLNRALRVGRAPKIVVDVLNMLEKAGFQENFTVVGTHALYAYESACGVHFVPQAMATRDIDPLSDTRNISLFFQDERVRSFFHRIAPKGRQTHAGDLCEPRTAIR